MRSNRRAVSIVAVTAFCFKMWLLSNVRTIAAFAPHDSSNFLEHASSIISGHWFGPYDGLALIKQPFFPLYLAFVQESGLTLAVANICFDLLVALVVVTALAPLFKRALAPSILFLLVFFQPLSLGGMRWTTDRSIINPDLALLVMACAIGLYVRRAGPLATQLRWSFALGLTFAAFWLNREDAVWIVPGLIFIAIAFIFSIFRQRREGLASCAGVLAIVPLICVLSVTAIKDINGSVYGWRITNEQQAPEFISAYNSLARIDVPKPRYIPIPRRARLLAYEVSPAARELRPTIEGADGAGWIGTTCATTPQLCSTHDLGGGWAEWAFRDGVMNAGHYDTAPHARAFYVQLASEIDSACADGRLKCLPKAASIFPPRLTPDDPAAIVSSLAAGFYSIRTLEQVRAGEAAAPAIPSSLRLDYDIVTRNLSDAGVHGFAGWILYNHAKPLKVIGPGSTDAQIVELASPDIVTAIGNDPRWSLSAKQHARFQLTSECGQECFLVAMNASGQMVDIPLRDDQQSFDENGVHLNLDASRYVGQFDNDLKYGMQGAIIEAYRVAFSVALPIALVLLAARILRSLVKRRPRLTVDAMFMAATTMSCSTYLLLLAVMDAVSFRLFPGTYIGTIEVLMITACAVIISVECTRLGRVLRRVLRAA